MPKPTPLPPGASPAAEAVWAAWSNAEIFFDIELTDRCALAAALRAAADYDPPDHPDAAYDMGWYAGMEFIKSIADEFEANL